MNIYVLLFKSILYNNGIHEYYQPKPNGWITYYSAKKNNFHPRNQSVWANCFFVILLNVLFCIKIRLTSISWYGFIWPIQSIADSWIDNSIFCITILSLLSIWKEKNARQFMSLIKVRIESDSSLNTSCMVALRTIYKVIQLITVISWELCAMCVCLWVFLFGNWRRWYHALFELTWTYSHAANPATHLNEFDFQFKWRISQYIFGWATD